MAKNEGKKKLQKWLKNAAIFTGLNWFAMCGAFLVTALNASYVDLGLAVATICFASQNITGGVQIWAACEQTAKAFKVNWITYVVCSAVEVALIIWWVLDYATYCGWYGTPGKCGNDWGSDFDGGLVFYYGIAIGIPCKVVCDVFVVMNMIKYTKEMEDNDVTVWNELDPDTNAFISKRNITLVVLE